MERLNLARGAAMATYDLLIKNVKVVNHDGESATPLDIAVTDGTDTFRLRCQQSCRFLERGYRAQMCQ